MSPTRHLYKNIDSIENKCAELISQIDHHLSFSDGHGLGPRSDPKNDLSKGVILNCHRTLIDYRSKKAAPKVDLTSLPHLPITMEVCNKMAKINQPLDDLITPQQPPNHLGAPAPLKKQVAFMDMQNGDNLQNGGNLQNGAEVDCSHCSATYRRPAHRDSHAAPVIDWQPHVQRRPTAGDSTAAIRAFLFGDAKKDGRHRAARSTVVCAKPRRDLARKKPRVWRLEEVAGGKHRKKVGFKLPKQDVVDKKYGQIQNNGLAPDSLEAPNHKKLLESIHLPSQKKENSKDSRKNEAGALLQLPLDEAAERKLASQLLRDSMKFCLKNTSIKEKRIKFSMNLQ